MTGNLPSPYDAAEEPSDEAPQSSERSRSVALILGVLGGVFGFHRFYVGRPQSAVFQALTLGGLGMWWLYDMVMILAGEFQDREGFRIRNWNVAETAGMPGVNSRTVSLLLQDMEQLQRQVGELAERVDFAERLLTQQRERERLSKGS
ncbi:MAG TPA: TM2 domain-containing protein [Gemmatimonadales bacterium]|jgi:TM2 domain-containing membrane protein YozV|nr:TM2 domain-containing protein [Gemmatimonadales bacterium]